MPEVGTFHLQVILLGNSGTWQGSADLALNDQSLLLILVPRINLNKEQTISETSSHFELDTWANSCGSVPPLCHVGCSAM